MATPGHKLSDILEIALNRFSDGGIDNISLVEIAELTGLAYSEMNQSFSSVDNLFDACIVLATRKLHDDLDGFADGDESPSERLLHMTHRLASPTPIEQVALFVLVRELLGGKSRAVRAFDLSLGPSLDAFARVVGESQFRDQMIPLPPRFLLMVVFFGVVVPQILGFGDVDAKLGGIHAFGDSAVPAQSALLAASIEAVFNGILRQPVKLMPAVVLH